MGAPDLIVPGTASGTTPVGGTGTTNTIPRWTGPSTLGDSLLIQTSNAITMTSTVNARLDFGVRNLSGGGSAYSQLFAGNDTDVLAGLLRNSSGNAGYAGPNSLNLWTVGAYPIGFVTGNQLRGVVDASGNFGIGTASPQARTHIKAANAAFRGQLTVEGDGTLAQITLYNGGTTSTDLVGQLYTDSAGNPNFHISAYKNTGALYFETGTSNTLRWQINSSGHLLAGADNSYDIGASGATRPRTVYVGTSVIVGPSATAAGTNANAIGQSCSAPGANSASIGQGCTAAGQNSSVLGASSRADGFGSCAVGYAVQTSANGSFALASGFQSLASLYGAHSHGSGNFAALGDAQKTLLVARVQTTNATATNLWLNGTSTRLAMPNSTAWAADVHLVARSATGAGHAYFVRRVLIKRDANAASTALVGTVQTIGTDIGSNAGAPPAGWAIAITADTTNGALDLQVTGALATTINWVARVELVEVSLA